MKRTKQILFTVTGIVFTILLFLLAMYLPKYLNAFFDQKTLNHVTQKNLNLKTYEISYSSFYEKLNAIARCRDEELHVVSVQKTGTKQEKEKITKIVQGELNLLLQEWDNGMLSNIILKSSNFVSCETFTLYSSSDTERLKGITYWKITYQKKKETFLFYLDEEYHKIYALEVTRKESSILDVLPGSSGSVMDVRQAEYGTDRVSSTFHELSYYYLGYLIRYFDLEQDEFLPFGDMEMEGMGDVVFQDGSVLSLNCQWEKKAGKKNNYITMFLGIYLEQMLQF